MPLFHYSCDRRGDTILARLVPEDLRLKKPNLHEILCEPQRYNPKIHTDKGPQKLSGLSGDWYLTEPRMCTLVGKCGIDPLTGEYRYEAVLQDRDILCEQREYIAQNILGVYGTRVYAMSLPPGTDLESVKFYYRGCWFTHTVKPEPVNG